ncbi:Vacuolar protein sorting-associated protein 62 [Dinochytrium kinnereticum]|nr:Vacuolar protein sorting-associated protein 62 [Dinochytrium kinnereticum]
MNLIKTLILLASLAAASTAAEPAPRSTRQYARAAPDEYDQLAKKFAPLIRFQLRGWPYKEELQSVLVAGIRRFPDEQYFSTSVDYFLSRVYMQDGNGNRAPNQPSPLSTSNLNYLRGGDDNQFLWVDGNVKADPSLPAETRWLNGNRNMEGVPMYTFVVPKANGVVDLHFQPYNLGKSTPLGRVGNHVGDWEHVIVRTQYGNPISIDYPTHSGDGVRVVPANDRRVKWVGTHPVVYTALGSHGSWPEAKKNVYKTVVLVYDLTDETGDNGPQWQTWNNVKSIMYRSGGNYPGEDAWLNYRGRFGNKGVDDCWHQKLTGTCLLGDGPRGPSRNLLGPPAQILATPNGDQSSVSFYLDAGAAQFAAGNGFKYVGVHLHCPGTKILWDNGDVERWGVVGFKGTGDLGYQITTDRCKDGRDRHVNNYEVAFCTSTDSKSCSKKSGYRNVRVFQDGNEVKALGVRISDPDPWSWNY